MVAPAPPAPAPQLSDGQQKHFETFGYLHLQALLTPDEIAAATARASALWASRCKTSSTQSQLKTQRAETEVLSGAGGWLGLGDAASAPSFRLLAAISSKILLSSCPSISSGDDTLEPTLAAAPASPLALSSRVEITVVVLASS